MPIDDSARVQFTIQCYLDERVSYNDPNHPRHTFPEAWDSASHPRFALTLIQSGFERLLAKGYTVHIELFMLRILNAQGDIVFEMKVPPRVG